MIKVFLKRTFLPRLHCEDLFKSHYNLFGRIFVCLTCRGMTQPATVKESVICRIVLIICQAWMLIVACTRTSVVLDVLHSYTVCYKISIFIAT